MEICYSNVKGAFAPGASTSSLESFINTYSRRIELELCYFIQGRTREGQEVGVFFRLRRGGSQVGEDFFSQYSVVRASKKLKNSKNFKISPSKRAFWFRLWSYRNRIDDTESIVLIYAEYCDLQFFSCWKMVLLYAS